jgi:large exoprotein involved in heme utilization and adhesion
VKVSGTIVNGQNPAGLFTQTEGSGSAGNLTIVTGQLIVQDGAQISASTQGNGGGGNLTVNARDSLAVIGTAANGQFPSGLFTNTGGTKPAGNLTIVTGQLVVRDGGQVSASTSNQGQGGTLAVKASESVELSGSSADGQLFSSLLTQTQGAGAAGDLRIVTGQLIVRDGALVSSSSRIEGAAGNLTVNASGSVEIIGTTPNGQRSTGLFSQTQGIGDAGDLTIKARQLIVRDGALVSARTLGEGLGGRLTVNASDSVELIGTSADGRYRSSLSASTEGGGDAGNLRIDTGRLILRDGAQAATGTFGKGKGGILTINAPESVELIGFGSGLFTQTQGSGDAGNLRIDTGQLAIQAGARISTASFAEGRGGDLQVNASKFVELIGTSADRQSSSGLSTQAVGTGNAGDLRIDTGRLILRDGAVVSAGTLSQGQGGTLAVTASESVELIGSGSGLSTETKSSGDAGNLRIDTGRLIVRDEALVSARTFGIGQGGNLTIATEQLNVGEGAAIAVNSVGTGRAGNLEVTSGSVSLENQGFIAATTLSGDGGNITLRVKDLLLMRDESEISTTAGTAQSGGDGGNITIDAEFIVAVPKENSDISADAFTGQGGNINITAQGLYGIEFRSQDTALSDITASSRFGVNGVVEINTPGVDPSQGLTNLPDEPVNNEEVAQGCQGGGTQASVEFFNTGRGGLAPNPYEPLTSSNIWEDVPSAARRTENQVATARASASPVTPSNKLVEAQGWLLNEKGEVVLVAQMPITHSESRCRLR